MMTTAGGIEFHNEIECKGQIECYDKVNELHPKYPIIIYNYTLKYKQKVKEYLDKIKS